VVCGGGGGVRGGGGGGRGPGDGRAFPSPSGVGRVAAFFFGPPLFRNIVSLF